MCCHCQRSATANNRANNSSSPGKRGVVTVGIVAYFGGAGITPPDRRSCTSGSLSDFWHDLIIFSGPGHGWRGNRDRSPITSGGAVILSWRRVFEHIHIKEPFGVF